MLVCRHAHMEVQCTCLSVCRTQSLMVEVPLNHPPPPVLRQGLSAEHRDNVTCVASQLSRETLSLPSVGITSGLPCPPGFNVDSGV